MFMRPCNSTKSFTNPAVFVEGKIYYDLIENISHLAVTEEPEIIGNCSSHSKVIMSWVFQLLKRLITQLNCNEEVRRKSSKVSSI